MSERATDQAGGLFTSEWLFSGPKLPRLLAETDEQRRVRIEDEAAKYRKIKRQLQGW